MRELLDAIMVPVFIFILVLAPGLASWIGRRKGRGWVEGLLLGVSLNWIGVAIEAGLPPKPGGAP